MYRQMILFCVSLGRSIRKGLITKLSKPSLLAPHPKCFELFPMEGSAHNISGCAFVTHVTSINSKEIRMHRNIDTHGYKHRYTYEPPHVAISNSQALLSNSIPQGTSSSLHISNIKNKPKKYKSFFCKIRISFHSAK